jgi:hypothetical protein
MMSVPCRYDLEPKSCVNDEVKVYNRKLKKHLKVFGNTCVVAVYCDRTGAQDTVCTSLKYVKIDLEKYCKDKDFEVRVCAIKFHFNTKNACIITIYRAQSGNFDLFISKLGTILRKLYTVTTEYIKVT